MIISLYMLLQQLSCSAGPDPLGDHQAVDLVELLGQDPRSPIDGSTEAVDLVELLGLDPDPIDGSTEAGHQVKLLSWSGSPIDRSTEATR